MGDLLPRALRPGSRRTAARTRSRRPAKGGGVLETVRLPAFREDGQALVEVCDSGVGIPKDEIPELMQRFYRASTAGTVEGTGFGLAISREIVERHQGRVEVESEEGIGSTFRVRPPLQDGAVRGSP